MGIKALHKQWKSEDMDGLLRDDELVFEFFDIVT